MRDHPRICDSINPCRNERCVNGFLPYPCKAEELNLDVITALKPEFGIPVGYSGREVGLQTTYAAVVLGVCVVEQHITLDRAMWGSDQAASVEPSGFTRLVRDIRVIEKSFGDGRKRVFESEIPVMKKLRRFESKEVGV
jgi:N-acetylneuraminate synthase